MAQFFNQPLLNRKPLFLFMLLYFIATVPSFAQYDSLLHKPYGENVNGIHAMYSDLIEIKDSLQRAKKAEEIKQFARMHKDRRLELNVDFFLNFWNAFYQNQPKEVSLRKLTEQVNLYTKENIDFLRARSLRALAEFYWKIEKNYELAFEQYLLLDKELLSATVDDYPEMVRDLMQIGEAYYYFQDYTVAKEYFKRTISLPENAFNSIVINAARNTLGLCYQQIGELDSAVYYFNEVQQTTFPESVAWKRIAKGNLGAILYKRKQYDKAIPLLEEDFYGSVEDNDFGCAAGAATALADIYRIQGKMPQAKRFIEYAQEYIQKTEQYDRLKNLYPVMSKWYADVGDIVLSKQYLDSSITALNRYNEKFNALKILRAHQKVDRQSEELRRSALTLEKERKTAERNLLFLLVLILCIVIVLTYFIQKKKQLTKDLDLQKASQELDAAKLNLTRPKKSLQFNR